MNHSDFVIGGTFWCGDRQWRCTDTGTRTIIAIRIDQVDSAVTDGSGPALRQTLTGTEAAARGWFNGPPYAVVEIVFDEYDLEACSLEPETDDSDFPAGSPVNRGSGPRGEEALANLRRRKIPR